MPHKIIDLVRQMAPGALVPRVRAQETALHDMMARLRRIEVRLTALEEREHPGAVSPPPPLTGLDLDTPRPGAP